MGFNRRLLSPFLAEFPLVARSMIGSCSQLAFAAVSMAVSKLSEEFVHNTRCANISQALSAGVGQLSFK